MVVARTPEVTASLAALSDFTQTQAAFEAAGLGTRVPTIEILWDNYCSLDPAQLADDLANLADRVMIHIMWSRFLDLDDAAFADYLTRLKHHVQVLRPVAVSDHLCCFQFDGLYVGAGQEYSYDRLDHVAARVSRYQDAIGSTLLIENNASLEEPVDKQIAFIHDLIERTGCGILFDVSNAVVGELNEQGSFERWLPLLAGRTLRCHVGSYHRDEDVDRFVDSHDREVSSQTEVGLRKLLATAGVEIASITYERDFNRTTEAIARDLACIAECICS